MASFMICVLSTTNLAKRVGDGKIRIKMKLRSRKANLKKDGSLLFELYSKCFNRSFDFRSFTIKEQIEYLKNFVVWIYYDGDEPIGFLTYRFEGNNKAELDTMAVLPEYQNKGIGKKMMSKFLKMTKGRKLYLVTHPKNTAALVLYLKHGFQIYGWKDNYYGDGEPRLLLERNRL